MEEAEEKQEPRGKRLPLFEIVIILAVLGMVAVMLAPLIGLSSQRAGRALCTAHAGKLATAIQEFAQDRGRLPGVNWHTDLLPYVDGRDVFRCPDETTPCVRACINYGYNAALLAPGGKGIAATRVKRPQLVGCLADADPARYWEAGGGLIGDYPLRPSRAVNLCARDAAVGRALRTGEYRHTSGVVIAYADGHATLVPCTATELLHPLHEARAAFERVKKQGHVK